MYGMLCVYDNLATSGKGSHLYFKHMMFLSRHLMERNFQVQACAKYDKYIVDKVVEGKSIFTEFDPMAAGLFLHGGAVMKPEVTRQHQTGPPLRFQTQGRSNQLRDCNRDNTPYHMSDTWPTDVCFFFNTRSCYGRCSKLHVCQYCRLNHRLADCKFAAKEGQGQARM